MQHTWQAFAQAEPELAAFGMERLKGGPAYLATVKTDGSPRVHPVTPILAEGHLLLFMEPTSPKGHDLARGSAYALHCWVKGNNGGDGEFYVSGHGALTNDPGLRALAAQYGYQPQEHYVLFEFSVESAFSTAYPDGGKPVRRRWSAGI